MIESYEYIAPLTNCEVMFLYVLYFGLFLTMLHAQFKEWERIDDIRMYFIIKDVCSGNWGGVDKPSSNLL